jgi:hypothetical protein
MAARSTPMPGALLICPERIVSVTPLDPAVVEAIRARGA